MIIKKFESFDNNIQELRNLCNDVLIELKDKSFVVNIEDMSNNSIVIEIYKEPWDFFTWESVKDYIISLLSLMEGDYQILNDGIDIFVQGYGTVDVKIDTMDEFKVDNNIFSISIDIIF